MCTDCPTTTLPRRALLGAALAAPAALVAAPAAATGGATAPAGMPRVLVFSRTAGFRHASIETAVQTIRELGLEGGFAVDATEDPTAFSRRGLAPYAAVVFANTTGNVLEGSQRTALERFVRGGGGWVGIHSAADTEYSSRFYSRLLAGGRFLAHPLQQPGVLVREAGRHRSTRHLPERWLVPFEEFYSFTRSVRGRSTVLLTIDERTYLQDPNTSNLPTGPEQPLPQPGVTGTMGDHPMAWTHRVDGGLSWYTALGHEIAMYRDEGYRRHLLGGLLSAVRHGQRHRGRD